MKVKPLVSVIITTKNEEKNIENCLQSIQKQTYPKANIEIIVVDNASTDTTKELAQKYTAHVYNKGPERSAQRNFGVTKSTGKYILYLDADMMLHPKLIEQAVDILEKEANVVALYISEVVVGDSLFAQVRRFERSFYDATVIDCVRCIRKDIFVKIGGFDATMSGPEDWDFDKKIRAIGKTKLLTTPIYHNESEMTLSLYLKKKAYYSQSFDTYIKKWGSDDPDVKKQFSPLYRYAGVFIEMGKWQKLLKHPILSVCMVALRMLVGIIFITRHEKK